MKFTKGYELIYFIFLYVIVKNWDACPAQERVYDNCYEKCEQLRQSLMHVPASSAEASVYYHDVIVGDMQVFVTCTGIEDSVKKYISKDNLFYVENGVITPQKDIL